MDLTRKAPAKPEEKYLNTEEKVSQMYYTDREMFTEAIFRGEVDLNCSNHVQFTKREKEYISQGVFRGEIWMADFSDLEGMRGSEMRGSRPVLVIQNNAGNKHSNNIVVASITHRKTKPFPTHLDITLDRPSTILFEHITTVDKSRLQFKAYALPDELMEKMDEKILISLGIMEPNERLIKIAPKK